MEQSIDEIDSSENLVDNYRRFPKAQPIAKRKHPQASELPETITILKEPINDATVYLVGTAHFRFTIHREIMFWILFCLVKRVNVKLLRYVEQEEK